MGWGMILAATSFLMAAFLQIAVDVRNVTSFFSIHFIARMHGTALDLEDSPRTKNVALASTTSWFVVTCN